MRFCVLPYPRSPEHGDANVWPRERSLVTGGLRAYHTGWNAILAKDGMNMQSSTAARVVSYSLAALTVAIRIGSNLVAAFNFVPVGALGLFGGSRLRSWQAYALPIATMVATDLGLAILKGSEYNLTHPSRIWVYGSYLIYVMIGRFLIADSKNPFVIGSATLLGALQFFLITNFCEWLVQPMYSGSFAGLLDSYWAAIPFSYNTFAADLIFTPLAFFASAMLTRQPAEEKELAAAQS